MPDCYTGEKWFAYNLLSTKRFPLSFTYNGARYTGFDPAIFPLQNEEFLQDDKAYRVTNLLQGPDGLKIRLVCAFYPAYDVSEWTVWFENEGAQDSGVLSDIETVLTFEGEKPVLKGILGDSQNQYRPYCKDLSEEAVHFESVSGRATHVNFPYFNLEYGSGGAMLAIGWAGTWTADFSAEEGVTTYRAKSVNKLNTYLKPGEKIRTALFVRAPYTLRDENYATNFWRSWFVNCNMPSDDASGAPVKPFSSCCLASDTGLPNSDGSISERYSTWRPSLEKMIAEDCKVDYRWFDAGWYIAPDLTSPEEDWWGSVGTWVLDEHKWPGNSFRESTDFAREHGMRTLMWFEPERVTDPENLAKNFGYNTDWAIRREGVRSISNNIGDPDCYRWTVDQVCRTLRDNKVEMYREDNNSDPAALWSYLDTEEGENRTGITECKFIQAHYDMWDEFIACTLSYGGCGFVDSCAGGGGRNDLESMRRGVPLLRSDSDRTTTSLRLSMTTAFNKWIPFCGANTKEKAWELAPTGITDPYTWRASYLPALNVDSQFAQDPDGDYDMLRFGLHEWQTIKDYLLKDFYVLTPWHREQEKDGFTAYCFYDPEKKKGVLLMFRMEECEEDTFTADLPFAKGTYRYTDADTHEFIECEGATTWTFPEKRTAKLIYIEKK